MLLTYAVDIIITDIEMPNGSGLELIKWVKENKPDIKAVFYTGHAEFSYAQEALRLGVEDASETALNKELVIRDGYLSVHDTMDDIYKYPEGYQAVQELIAAPLAVENPAMAKRMAGGGGLSFHSVWGHIGRMLPDEAYYLLNERLNKIKK